MIKTADKLTFYAGNSMWPTLLPADRLTLEECDAKALRPGEIVVYQNGARLAVHRVLAVRGRNGQTWVRTRGDNSRKPDPEWPAERLIGRVTEVSPVKGRPRTLRPMNPELIRLRLIARKAWGKLKRFLGLNARRGA